MRSTIRLLYFSLGAFLLSFPFLFADQPSSGSDRKNLMVEGRSLIKERRYETELRYLSTDQFEPFQNELTRTRNVLISKSGANLVSFREQAALHTIADDFLVNDDTTGGYNEQNYPAIARSQSGNFVITWVDWRTGYPDIYAQLYDLTGAPKGFNFRVNDYSTYYFFLFPVVAMDSSGNFVIVWRDYRNEDDGDIYAQRYDSTGNPSGSNFKVNDDVGSNFQSDPVIAMHGSGSFVITWSDRRGGYTPDIYAQRYDSTGTPVDSNFRVNELSVYDDVSPDIAMDKSGNFAITWHALDLPDYLGIHAQRYTSSGIPLDSNFVVGGGMGHATAMDASGKFVIAMHWGSSIHAQRYDSIGTPLDSSFQVNDDTISVHSISNCDVASNDSGNFIITWEAYHFTMGRGVMAQRYDSSGNPLGANFRVNNTIRCKSLFPAIASDHDGNFAITWADYRNSGSCFGSDGADPDVYAQMYDSAGDSLGTNFRVVDDVGVADQEYPVIAADRSGNFVIIWEGIGNAQRFDSTGTSLGNNFEVINGRYKAITMDDSGNFVVTVSVHSYNDWNVYAQRYNYLGAPIDSIFRVNDDTTGIFQWVSAVAMNSSGNFVIAWQDNGDIYAQRYDISGASLGSNFMVNNASADLRTPGVAMDESGSFVVTWASLSDIYAQRYDSSGAALGTNFTVTEQASIGPWAPSIAMGSSGNFVVVWRDLRNDICDIYAQRYNSLGSTLGSNFRVSDIGSPIEFGHFDFPAVAMEGSTNFVVAWADLRHGNWDIYAQRYDSAGVLIGSNYLVPNLQYVSFAQKAPSVVASESNIYFTWQDNRRAKGWDIYAKLIDWTWTKVEEDKQVSVPNLSKLYQNYPNPFNPFTTIHFRVGSSEIGVNLTHTTLKIYNILGQLVKTLINEEKVPGIHSVVWDGKDEKGIEVSSGVYLYRLSCGELSETKKLVLLR